MAAPDPASVSAIRLASLRLAHSNILLARIRALWLLAASFSIRAIKGTAIECKNAKAFNRAEDHDFPGDIYRIDGAVVY